MDTGTHRLEADASRLRAVLGSAWAARTDTIARLERAAASALQDKARRANERNALRESVSKIARYAVSARETAEEMQPHASASAAPGRAGWMLRRKPARLLAGARRMP